MLTWLDNLLFCIDWPFPLVIILFIMGAIAFVSVKKEKLTMMAALAAIVEGTVVLWCLRFEGFFIFFLFFFTSIILEKYVRIQHGRNEKHEARDILSVLANGAMATIAALHFYNTGYNGALLMFGAAIAEAASDTWAGELGRLSVKPPVSIRTFKEVKKGLSGGVTPLGFLAGFSAVVFIALVWVFCFPIKNRGIGFTIICFTGFAGCVLDSYIGATCQALYEDAETGELTEEPKTEKGEENKLVRGYEWMDNDAVNFISNFTAAITAMALSAILY